MEKVVFTSNYLKYIRKKCDSHYMGNALTPLSIVSVADLVDTSARQVSTRNKKQILTTALNNIDSTLLFLSLENVIFGILSRMNNSSNALNFLINSPDSKQDTSYNSLQNTAVFVRE